MVTLELRKGKRKPLPFRNALIFYMIYPKLFQSVVEQLILSYVEEIEKNKPSGFPTGAVSS